MRAWEFICFDSTSLRFASLGPGPSLAALCEGSFPVAALNVTAALWVFSTSMPQLPLQIPHITSNRNNEALDRGTFGRAGHQFLRDWSAPTKSVQAACTDAQNKINEAGRSRTSLTRLRLKSCRMQEAQEVCVHVYKHIHIRIHMHIHTYVRLRMRQYICAITYTYTFTCLHLHKHIHVHIHIHIPMNIHIHIHTHTEASTHSCTLCIIPYTLRALQYTLYTLHFTACIICYT